MKKDEKDAGSRLWNARISLASLELGFLALNLRSRDCSWRVEGEKATARSRYLRRSVDQLFQRSWSKLRHTRRVFNKHSRVVAAATTPCRQDNSRGRAVG